MPNNVAARRDIKAAIRFYEARGWDWLDVVAFLSARATFPWWTRPRWSKRRED